MAAENESGFEIDGDLYPVPTIDSFDMDEAQVLYDYCGLTLEDFVEPEDEADDDKERREARFRNPGFIRALMHITYQRKHTDLKPMKVKALIGKANLIAAAVSLMGSVPEEDEESPLASTTEPVKQSENEPVISNESSGDDSTTASDPPDSQPANTGTGKSDTSSPESAPKLSVA